MKFVQNKTPPNQYTMSHFKIKKKHLLLNAQSQKKEKHMFMLEKAHSKRKNQNKMQHKKIQNYQVKNTSFPKKNYQKRIQTEVKTTLIKKNFINGQARAKDVTKEGTYRIILQGSKEIKTTKKLDKICFANYSNKNNIRLVSILYVDIKG